MRGSATLDLDALIARTRPARRAGLDLDALIARTRPRLTHAGFGEPSSPAQRQVALRQEAEGEKATLARLVAGGWPPPRPQVVRQLPFDVYDVDMDELLAELVSMQQHRAAIAETLRTGRHWSGSTLSPKAIEIGKKDLVTLAEEYGWYLEEVENLFGAAGRAEMEKRIAAELERQPNPWPVPVRGLEHGAVLPSSTRPQKLRMGTAPPGRHR
jgi:hypothetical protein